MVKLLVFDLDGVLVEAKEIHYIALNKALASIDVKYCIDAVEHNIAYDGLPTKKKLELLTTNKGLPESCYGQVWATKQKETVEVIRQHIRRDDRLCNVLSRLHKDYKIYVASNSISESVRIMLYQSGLIEHVDYYISNEDVKNPKPHSEMYLRCMIHAGVNPKECVIVEDSLFGRQGALAAGGHVLGVDSTQDVTYERVANFVESLEPSEKKKWPADDLVVLIPMAGAGKRFQEAGYSFPKPLIDVQGKPMIQVVVENMALDAHFVFVVQKSHYEKYNLKHLLNLIAPGCDIVQIDGVTEGGR